jgi:membrane dipeptidase
MKRVLLATALALGLTACATPSAQTVHERLLTLDTHLDTPALLGRSGWRIQDRHEPEHDYSQVDLPRMIAGGLDGGFFVIYTPQGPRTPEGNAAALAAALERGRAIRAMVDGDPEHFALALRASDAARIARTGKRIVYMSIENSYPIEGDLSQIQTFYDLGVRLIGPVHTRNNDFADSATDQPQWHGLSPLGRQLVQEANRLGMVLDASHASNDVFDQMLELSATPIILSHSGPSAVYAHPRNIDDERLRRLAAKGGVIQINSLGSYLRDLPPAPERMAALAALRARFGPESTLSGAQAEAFYAARREIDARYPAPQADFEDFMRHLLHALEVVGPRHVGIGADWDGGGGVHGMEDVSALPKITERLIAAGYSEADLRAIWGGNVLRVLRAAEAHAQQH